MDQQILANLINSLTVEERQSLLQSIAPKPVPSIPNPISTGPTIIPATMTYEHETNHTIPQPIPNPIPTPAPVQLPTDEPPFHLTGMEQDLATVLKYCVDNKQQTIFTVENTFLQQLLRMMLRVEEKINTLEELITNEVLSYSKDTISASWDNPTTVVDRVEETIEKIKSRTGLDSNKLVFESIPTEDNLTKDQFVDDQREERLKLYSLENMNYQMVIAAKDHTEMNNLFSNEHPDLALQTCRIQEVGSSSSKTAKIIAFQRRQRNDNQEETSQEERTQEVEEPTQEGNDERVRSSSRKSKGKRRKSKKRRRNRSNSEN